ncbi:hypothetical protein PLICRDRAFT_58536 [Plicaturopsis crispa FD-325 SS-3]|uniref:DUF7587 domain-containing protein n=1 Tax=Plicaturopsis crispa FD-325 SS-3 TaxID=944288 RepID=A0A0C9T575_PLICR|nr:hypothetical protein PLICRDRAFT_58536 [Plicaturopsis crispa FD-325 SS-3]
MDTIFPAIPVVRALVLATAMLSALPSSFLYLLLLAGGLKAVSFQNRHCLVALVGAYVFLTYGRCCALRVEQSLPQTTMSPGVPFVWLLPPDANAPSRPTFALPATDISVDLTYHNIVQISPLLFRVQAKIHPPNNAGTRQDITATHIIPGPRSPTHDFTTPDAYRDVLSRVRNWAVPSRYICTTVSLPWAIWECNRRQLVSKKPIRLEIVTIDGRQVQDRAEYAAHVIPQTKASVFSRVANEVLVADYIPHSAILGTAEWTDIVPYLPFWMAPMRAQPEDEPIPSAKVQLWRFQVLENGCHIHRGVFLYAHLTNDACILAATLMRDRLVTALPIAEYQRLLERFIELAVSIRIWVEAQPGKQNSAEAYWSSVKYSALRHVRALVPAASLPAWSSLMQPVEALLHH